MKLKLQLEDADEKKIQEKGNFASSCTAQTKGLSLEKKWPIIVTKRRMTLRCERQTGRKHNKTKRGRTKGSVETKVLVK